MKRSFLTGLALLLPVVLTLMIVLFLVNLLTGPFEEFVEEILLYYGVTWGPFAQKWFSKGLTLVTLSAVLILVGMLAQFVLTRYFIRIGEAILQHIPIINKIYRAAQDVVRTVIGTEDQTQYSRVVLVPFHMDGSNCVGFMTSESHELSQELYSIFVPATPNPTMGFLLLYHPEDVVFLDISVEEALKMVISCGVLANELKIKS